MDDFEIEEENEQKTRPLLTKGMQLYLLAMLCGSLMKACSKMLVMQLNLFVVLFFRMLITGLISFTSMQFKGVDHYFWGPKGVRTLLFIRGLLGTFNIALTYFALKYLSLPDQSAITFLTPLVTSIFAKVILGEEYRIEQALASLVSLSGVIIIAKPKFDLDVMRTLAIISTLLVVLSAATVMIVLRKIGDRAHALTSVFNYSVQTIIFSMAVLLYSGAWELPKSAINWLLIGGMGIFGFGLQYFSSMAIQMEEATSLANLKYTQLIYATILELIFFHDFPDIISLVGIALTIIGVAVSARIKQRLNRQ